jgi:hypothetical protein
LIATISLKGEGLVSQIKRSPDVQILELTAANRESLVIEVVISVRNLIPLSPIVIG